MMGECLAGEKSAGTVVFGWIGCSWSMDMFLFCCRMIDNQLEGEYCNMSIHTKFVSFCVAYD